MCEFCKYQKLANRKQQHLPKRWEEDYDEDEEDDDEDDPRCDFEKEPSMANGWFYNL
jgi:hypothetical protein